MIRQIVSGYLGILRAMLRIAVMLAVCLGSGALIVWPLWKLATTDPSVYTILFTVLVAAIVVFLVITHCRKAFRKNPKGFLYRFASILVLVAGFALAVVLVFAWQRVWAAIAVAVTLALYGFLAFGLAPDHRRSAS